MIQKTSLESFVKSIPKFETKRKQIYRVIEQCPGCSNNDIARFLGWEINTVTPRVKELRDKNLVKFCRLKYDPLTNRTVIAWKSI